MQKHVFISYARVDGETFSRRLYDDLQDDEFEAWLDVYEIKSGSFWDSDIDHGLQTAQAVTVALTPGSVSSKQVNSEWNYAINHYIPVIPLLISDCDIPRMLETLQYIDFRDNYKRGLSKLRKRLRDLKTDFSEELKRILASLEREQSLSAAPERFQEKIDDLKKVIADWEDRREIQQQRIETGLERERQAIIQESRHQQQTHRQRIIGQRLMDVADHFVGRSRHQNELNRFLADRRKYVISIIGPPGFGKTALACKVLAELEQHQRSPKEEEIPVDGIAYLSTQTGGITLEQLYLDCAKMLGGKQQEELQRVWSNPQIAVEDKIQRLLESLSLGWHVILLDHMDVLLDRDGTIIDEDLRIFFEQSLIFPHNSCILITTRDALNFQGHMKAFDQAIKLDEGLSVEEGIAALRNLDPHNDCGLRDAPQDQLARAVQKLHGIPRALEILAGILAEDPLSSLEDILKHFYEEKVVVEDLIEGGYKRLDSDERRVIEALAVFRRPVAATALDCLLEPFVPGLNLPSVLRRLARAQMVKVDRSSGTVSLQPIDQDFAYRRCPQTAEYNCRLLELRAADYYARLRTAPSHWQTMAGLTPLLRQFEHLVHAAEYDQAAAVLDEFESDYLIMRGHAKRALSMRSALNEKLRDRRLLMSHEFGLARAHSILGPLSEAIAHYKKALELSRELKDVRHEAEMLGWLGEASRRCDRLDEAKAYLDQAVAIYRKLGQKSKEEARWLAELSFVCTYRGDLIAALSHGSNALELAMQLDEPICQALAHDCLALIYLVLGRLQEALQSAETAIDLYQKSKWENELVYVVNAKALAYIGMGQLDEGLSHLQKAQSQAHEDNNTRIEGITLFNLARVFRKKNEPATALEAARRSQEILAKIGAGGAAAAGCLAEAIQAVQTDKKWAAAKAFLDCAADCIRNPDLLDPQDIIHEACNIAEKEGMNELLARGHTILKQITARHQLSSVGQ